MVFKSACPCSAGKNTHPVLLITAITVISGPEIHPVLPYEPGNPRRDMPPESSPGSFPSPLKYYFCPPCICCGNFIFRNTIAINPLIRFADMHGKFSGRTRRLPKSPHGSDLPASKKKGRPVSAPGVLKRCFREKITPLSMLSRLQYPGR